MSGETERKFENEIECDSVNSILELILNHDQNETDNDSAKRVKKNRYFRGENSYYELRTPSLYLQEGLTLDGSEYYYRMLLSELGRDDYQENTSLVRLISELQHYGAKTRVLDITSNPLIALYFAVEKKDDKSGDDKSGYVFIYESDEENEKFDTGHTIAIKSALNLIPQEIINNFFKAVNFICKDESELERLENVPLENLNKKLKDKLRERNQELYEVKIEELEASIAKFMELLNQRARVRERLNLPFKIAMDLGKAHIVIPSKTTDRIRQQQGAFIYKSDEENEKFDTGHTIAIESALNLIPQKIINNFLKAVNFICKDESELEKLENVPLENLNKKLKDKLRERNQELYEVKIEELEASIAKFMELLNQRARVRERLNLPFKIAMDLGKAHIVIPSKTTDRIRQQQGAFIYPKFTDTSDKTHEEVKKEISESINHFNATLKIQKEDKKDQTCLLSVIRIDGNNKEKIRTQLKLLGITEGFVYPDIEHKSNALLGISQNGNKTAQNKSN